MNRLLNLLEKIGNKVFDLLTDHWPIALAAAAIGFLFLIFIWDAIARWLNGQKRSNQSRIPEDTPTLLPSLKRLSSAHYRTFADLYLPRPMTDRLTHLDYIVISHQGIFVILVETGPGEVFGEREATVWKCLYQDRTRQLPNPLRRNDDRIRALAYFLGQPESIFRSIILFPDEVCLKLPQPAHVLTSGLGRYIIAQPVEPLITGSMLEKISSKLETTSRQMNRSAMRRAYNGSKRKRQPH